jgi:hypothetical protein
MASHFLPEQFMVIVFRFPEKSNDIIISTWNVKLMERLSSYVVCRKLIDTWALHSLLLLDSNCKRLEQAFCNADSSAESRWH